MGTPILVTGAAGRVGGVGGGGEASRSEGAHQYVADDALPNEHHRNHSKPAAQIAMARRAGVELVRTAGSARTAYRLFTSDSVKNLNQIRLPFGDGKTSPVAAEDVARVVAALLAAAHRQD